MLVPLMGSECFQLFNLATIRADFEARAWSLWCRPILNNDLDGDLVAAEKLVGAGEQSWNRK